ncbi:MAG: hypothetical protein LC720_08695, partial [Actinobacteria bacterium]|nr:hypothetical protein [Actinomycetota bacterium]
RLIARLEAEQPALAAEAKRIVGANPSRSHVIAQAAAMAAQSLRRPSCEVAPASPAGAPGIPATEGERSTVPPPAALAVIGPPAPLGPIGVAPADQLALFVEAAPPAAA